MHSEIQNNIYTSTKSSLSIRMHVTQVMFLKKKINFQKLPVFLQQIETSNSTALYSK